MLRRGPFGPQMPGLPQGKSLWLAIGGGLVALWVVFTSVHQLDRQEDGVVIRLGSYSRTVGAGINFTLPAPFEQLVKVPVRAVQTTDIPNGNGQNLVLTGDANIINLTYTVRWSIKQPAQYLFQMENSDGTIRDAAESAMRATVANFTLAQAITNGKSEMEAQVQVRLQEILDSYGVGVRVEGINIRSSAPPQEVQAAFDAVNAAKQQADGQANEARGIAEQIRRRAEGEAAQFDRVYAEYRLAPEVTRRRMYYETMEQILSKADKTIVDSRGVTPYMALPDVRRRTPAAPVAPATPAGER
jgi:membrane protease subunit HflK